ncbi:MAG TPA: FtsX-like permease family protein [Pyrinomonadaceae bacterium]|nr:FtsX-like permease family protein [Pyrinomonadaceae bacterium]
MNFIVNLTWREIRSSWRRLLFFFLCIAIGVGSIVALRSLIQNLSQAVGGDARELLTADLVINSTNDFSPNDVSKIEAIVGASSIIEARNEAIETSAMARPVDAANQTFGFVELKGIEPPFPLVGKFTLSGGEPFDFKLLENGGAVVAPILLEKLNIKVGDKIRIGEIDFEIRATFDEEPGGASGFRLGSRVFIEKKAFEEAGITRTGGRIRRRILYRTSDNPTELVKLLRESLKGTTITVQSYRETQENLNEQFERTENYLSLTGLLILVLGGVGVWNVARVFVEQKRKSIAVLKCLGASGTRIITVYLLQILTLGLIGSLFGVFLAQIFLWYAAWQFADALPAAMSYAVHFSTAWQGVLLGILISLLFSALPLLQVRTIKPNLLLRDEAGEKMRRLDPTKLIFGAVSLAGLLGLAAWQAGSVKVGAIFLVGLGVTALFLYLAAIVLTRLLRRIKNFGSFAVAQAVNSLYRPGNQTRVILLAVGLGAFVVLAVQSLQANLVREFDFTRNQKLPSLFFIDIQKSQIDELKKIVEQRSGEAVQVVPTIRARISLVNGEPFDFQQREVRQQQGQIGREFAITYRPNLDENETVIAGEWWKEIENQTEAEVSVEEDMSGRLNVAVGDWLTFDISGRKINARVANIRKLDLRNTRTAFVFVFRPGTLEKAPQTFVATVLKKLPETERARLQRNIIDEFPNVQIFDVADIVAAVQKLVNNFVLAISFVGSFVILSGMLILIGSIALTKSQRIYENAVLKTLGAKRPTLAAILLAEYGILGVLAGIIGAGFATLLSFVASKYVFLIDWEFDTSLTMLGVLITASLVMLVGAAASFDVLFRKPLAILRSQ